MSGYLMKTVMISWPGKGWIDRLYDLFLAVFVIAVVALLAAATTVLWLQSPSIELTAAAMPPLQELHAMAGVHKLPVQEIEDQSLVYPTAEKR